MRLTCDGSNPVRPCSIMTAAQISSRQRQEIEGLTRPLHGDPCCLMRSALSEVSSSRAGSIL